MTNETEESVVIRQYNRAGQPWPLVRRQTSPFLRATMSLALSVRITEAKQQLVEQPYTWFMPLGGRIEIGYE